MTIEEDTETFAMTISFGTLSAEYDVFYDHCDGCAQCASKRNFCAEGMKLLDYASAVANHDADARKCQPIR